MALAAAPHSGRTRQGAAGAELAVTINVDYYINTINVETFRVTITVVSTS